MRKFMIFGLFAAFIGFAFADDIADRQTVTSLTYVNDELSEKQDIFGAQSGTKVATFTNTAGEITPREVKSDLGNNTNDTALPTVSAVNTGLDATQDTLGANKHADYVATYTNAPGELGEKGIYQDSGTYAEQQNALVDAGTFNAALQNGLDNEFVCAGNDPATGNCWLWTTHNGPVNLFNGTMYKGGLNLNVSFVASNFKKITSPYTPNSDFYGPTFYARVKPNTKYMVTMTTSARYKYVAYYSNESDITDRSLALGYANVSNNMFTTPSGANYAVISFTNANTNEITWSNVELYEIPDSILVPYAYTPLEYIEATNETTTINLGLSGDMNFLVVAQSSRIKGASQTLLSSTNGGNTSTWFGEATTTHTWGVSGASGAHAIYSTEKISANITFDSFGARGTVNGQTIVRNKDTTQQNWCLFSTCIGYYPFLGKVWTLRAYQNGVLVGNFIPAKRNSDNEIGMYDTVSGTFKTNTGTGTLIAGPEISNNVYLPQNQ
ncbi:MAG: hypothetical protein J6Y07_03740 [Alphaproteobacteria bacterium]|nr:hypothetical protein [Alphaproteobacteria bacterium]